MAETEQTETNETSGELLQVRRNRYREARAAEMSIVEAKMFADSDIDIGELRRLVKYHFPAGMLAEMLL